jgi:pSer/pThr/pTyr-binding forkhead associated (FHA) protein
VQLTLNISGRGKVFSVQVRDLESRSGTLLNGKKMPKGQTRQAFIGDKIQIGNSILVLKQKRAVIEVGDAVIEVDENMLTNVVTIDSSPESSPICDKKVAKTKKGSDGITIFIQEGPHKGDTFFLDRQGTHTCNVGRQPPISRSKVISTYSLEHDSSVSSSHTKLVLNSGRVYSVQVKDLNSSEGTFVNGKLVPKGGSRQAFIGDKIKIGNSVMQVVGL